MFTSLLPDNEDYRVFFSPYAERYFMKQYAKEYKAKRWGVTLDSIFQDLKRVHSLQLTQQVDELKRGKGCKLFKYDFAVAQSEVSPKASGNRCVVFLDENRHRLDVLMVFHHKYLPKNVHETRYIHKVIQEQFKELWERLD
jgi:hypothetical protein